MTVYIYRWSCKKSQGAVVLRREAGNQSRDLNKKLPCVGEQNIV
jgi:hypothetical protein